MPEPGVRRSLKIQSPWEGSAAWASMMVNGSLELELFDYSPQAQQSLGGDVAWIYTVQPDQIPRLFALLDVPDEAALLDAFALRFAHVHAIRDWLKQKQIPYIEKFDSQA